MRIVPLVAVAALLAACQPPPPSTPAALPPGAVAPPAVPGGRVFLGIVPAQVNPAVAKEVGLDRPRGLYVLDVREGGAAIRNGIDKGDILLSIDGRPLVVNEDLGAAIAGKVQGDKVPVTIWRGGREVSATMQL